MFLSGVHREGANSSPCKVLGEPATGPWGTLFSLVSSRGQWELGKQQDGLILVQDTGTGSQVASHEAWCSLGFVPHKAKVSCDGHTVSLETAAAEWGWLLLFYFLVSVLPK